LQGASREAVTALKEDSTCTETVQYADGLRYNLNQGWYEFRCACQVAVESDSAVKAVSDWLGDTSNSAAQQPAAYVPVIKAYMLAETGGNLAAGTSEQVTALAQSVATLYARMVAGDDLIGLLQEMKDKRGSFTAGMNTACAPLV